METENNYRERSGGRRVKPRNSISAMLTNKNPDQKEKTDTTTGSQGNRQPNGRHGSASGRRRPYHGSSNRSATSGRSNSGSPKRGGRSARSGRISSRRAPVGRHVATKSQTETTLNIPPAGDNIRIIPLGGVEEIGKNMTAIEFRDDIIVLDMGFQFRDENTPGIDYVLPNTKYLEERKDKIRGVLITHGHLDHIGGIPYIMERIGNPPLYSRELTTIMIRKRQEEFPHQPPLNIKVIEKDETIRLGDLKIRFFAVTHTIPDSMGVIIDTPYGSIVNPGDVKLDHVDGVPIDAEAEEYGRFNKENVLFLMMDSTNVENPGFSTPESLVHEGLEEVIRQIKGRLIIGTFASQIQRMIKIIEIAERLGKKIVVEGRSMKTNIDIAIEVGSLKVKKDTIITGEQMDNYPPDRIVALATGAQGDEFAALMRMSMKTHKFFKINKRDTVLLSSSIIPGNEKAVEKLKDNLARQGARIIHYRSSDVYVHSTGHGNKGELEWIHKQIKPKFFMPIHGNYYRIKLHAELAYSLGMKEDEVAIADNGAIIEIQDQGKKLVRRKEAAPSSPVLVDGFSIGDIQEVLIRDRKMLADDGMFVIVATLNTKTGKLRKSPDIISRGFVYLRESQDLLQQTRLIIKKTIENSVAGMNPINFDFVKANITDDVTRFLFQKTAKRPIVIPVILGV